jgi:hypothetical protein
MKFRLGWGVAILLGLSGTLCSGTKTPDGWWTPTESAAFPGGAALGPVLGAEWEKAWSPLSGVVSGLTDKALSGPGAVILGPQSLILQGRTLWPSNMSFQLTVRYRTDVFAKPALSLGFGSGDPKAPGFRFSVGASRGSETLNAAATLNGQGWSDSIVYGTNRYWTPDAASRLAYQVKSYLQVMPGWPENYRVQIEKDMVELDGVSAKWVDVRIDNLADEIRFWVDDRLVGRKSKSDEGVPREGFLRIEMTPGMEWSGLTVRVVQPTPGFIPLQLKGYANARGLTGGRGVQAETLPPAGQAVRVAGIPFIFTGMNSEGWDHLDLGRSFLRQGNERGYLPANGPRWIGAALRDPARIQMRIPNGDYKAFHIIAASDGDKDSLPVFSVMFYRPQAGFAETFKSGEVPLLTARPQEVKPLGVRLENGRSVNLWRVTVPLDPGRLSAFGDLDIVEVELTKEVYLYRSYPDPISYGWHPGGLPSGVHIYAATLEETPVRLAVTPDQFGFVWTAPEVPSCTVRVTNRTGSNLTGRVVTVTRSYDGTETNRVVSPVQIQVARGLSVALPVRLPVKLNGYHDLTVTFEGAGITWVEKRSLVRLAPDTRPAKWTEGNGPLFGYWSYGGGHYTPSGDLIAEVMIKAGGRASMGPMNSTNSLVRKHWSSNQAGAWEITPQKWAASEPVDPAQYAAYQTQAVAQISKSRAKYPADQLPDHVYFFPEPSISHRLTDGNPPEYANDQPYVLTSEEEQRLRMFKVTTECAAEGVRKNWPGLKILVPWGDPLFVVPLLRSGLGKDSVAGSGLDICGFERLPEQQLTQISLNRLYVLKKEFAKAGIPNPRLQFCEGIFVPTEPGAVSWREQMDIYNRWSLISLAYGVDRFYSGWFAFDCGSYYGAEHYGGCGIQRRIPYCDPKPGYAAFATLTEKLAGARFVDWLPTGSLNTYCLHFQGPQGHIYTLWTLRGRRPATLNLSADGPLGVTDAMNNTRMVKSAGKSATVTLDSSVLYVTSTEPLSGVRAGPATQGDAAPAPTAQFVADLSDGSWNYAHQALPTYESNTLGIVRYHGQLSASFTNDPDQGKALVSTLDSNNIDRALMPLYDTLVPAHPLPLGGAPSALGLWVRGAGDWGRVVYVLRDAKGERWISIGSPNDYNCDDIHSWSAFNFDGWRYLRFELPGHLGYDSFRRHGTTWWRSDGGDDIVDLPLHLESILVEQRQRILYVNDIQPVTDPTVAFGKLYVEYEQPEDATEEAVRRSALRMPTPTEPPPLPNPIANRAQLGALEPSEILKLTPPEYQNDGTRTLVTFKTIPQAVKYQIWVAAYPDGRGAVNMTPAGAISGQLLTGLRPGIPFYFWVVWEDAVGKLSKLSKVQKEILVDRFKEK